MAAGPEQEERPCSLGLLRGLMDAASISWCEASCLNDSSASEARELPDAMRAEMLSSFRLATSFIRSWTSLMTSLMGTLRPDPFLSSMRFRATGREKIKSWRLGGNCSKETLVSMRLSMPPMAAAA